MSKKKHKRSRSGHYCWCCDRNRPNEKFSGKGHAKHLCKDCSKLGSEEVAFRQAQRNLERCVTWEGIIPRKRRKQFAQFLDHCDHRIREIAQEMQQEDERARLRLRFESQSHGSLDFDGGIEDMPFDVWNVGESSLSPEDCYRDIENVHERHEDTSLEAWNCGEFDISMDGDPRDIPF